MRNKIPLRYNSVFVKNYLIIISMIIILTLCASTYIYFRAADVIENEMQNLNDSYIDMIGFAVDSAIGEVNYLAVYLSQRSDVQRFMISKDIQEVVGGEFIDINRSILAFSTMYKYIDSIYLYSEGTKFIISNVANSNIDDFKEKPWWPYYDTSQYGFIEVELHQWTAKRPDLVFLTKPVYLNPNNKIGCIIINIDVRELGKSIEQHIKKNPGNIFILDNNDNIIYNKDNIKSYDKRSKSYKEFIDSHPDYRTNVITSIQKSEVSNWKYVSVMHKGVHRAEVGKNAANATTFIIILFLIGLIIAFYISIKTYQPIKGILSVLKDGNSKVIKDQDLDEMKFILTNIRKSEKDRKVLVDELDRRIKLLKEVKAAALQAQINPHFLSNTLDNLRWMAFELTNDDNELTSGLEDLSKLMRLSLDMSSGIVPLSEEIDHVKTYIKIVKIRHPKGIQVVWNIDKNIINYKVIKLFLQPLIENAIEHGLKYRRYRGTINISGFLNEEKEKLTITVKDDGLGMEKEKLNRLNESMHDTNILQAEHIGLRNVNQRIKLVFGESYGIRVESRFESGTTIEVDFPIIF